MVCNGGMFTNYGKLDGLYMIDFTKKELRELKLMLDKLSRMCGVRNFAYGCAKCPLMDKGMRCAYLLLDKMLIMYNMRHEDDYRIEVEEPK